VAPPPRRSKRKWILAAVALAAVAMAGVAGWRYGSRAWRQINANNETIIPTAQVHRGDVSLAVSALGELRGVNPDVLVAPMIGGSELHVVQMRSTGDPVKAGDIIVQFDTAEQEFKLKEAEADFAEAEQKLANAKAARDAQEEEDRYALAKAKSDVRLAELDVRKNPLLPALVAKQNDMALEAWGQHLTQLEQNLLNRKATGAAAIASQEAARGKAETQASVARQNIQAMSLKAKRDGYVSVKANTSGNFFFWGMTLPVYQIGDSVRPGMAVAEIPDMKNWEIAANIGELDRGHIALGEPVAITIIAAPMRPFRGHVSNLGGTTGPPWDRRFECKIQLDDPSSELRPGMSAQIVVTTDAMRNVLWLPSQALFESDGRTFVYVRSGATFSPKDVKLVRRSETRVVIEGLAEGQVVALANPGEMRQKKAAKGAMQSIPK
jgi:multidrug resistance efflux pump